MQMLPFLIMIVLTGTLLLQSLLPVLVPLLLLTFLLEYSALKRSVETISFSTLGTSLPLRFLLSARNTRKETNVSRRHTALFWVHCHESKMMMAMVLAISICS